MIVFTGNEPHATLVEKMLTGKNSESSNILDSQKLWLSHCLREQDIRLLRQYREDAVRFEPGMAYPASMLDQYFPQQAVDSFMREPARDELFINGKLD